MAISILPSSVGKGRAGGNGHTQPLAKELSSFLVRHSPLLRGSPSHLGIGRGDRGHRSPTSSGEGRADGHGHTHVSS